jgi:hypothetical protein
MMRTGIGTPSNQSRPYFIAAPYLGLGVTGPAGDSGSRFAHRLGLGELLALGGVHGDWFHEHRPRQNRSGTRPAAPVIGGP